MNILSSTRPFPRRDALRLLAAATFATPAFLRAQAAGPAWKSIFDGRSLAGWQPTAKSSHSKASGNTSGGRWVAEDGAIVGGQDIPRNGGLLLTTEEYGDVEVALETNNDFGNFAQGTKSGHKFEDMDADGNAKRQFFQTAGTLTLTALSANRQTPFAHAICCGVRQSGSKSRGLATTMTVQVCVSKPIDGSL